MAPRKKKKWRSSSSCSCVDRGLPGPFSPRVSISPRGALADGNQASLAAAQLSPRSPPRGEVRASYSVLGFPSDFIGSHSFPHLASSLSRLWSLPSSFRASFRGGWIESPFRPPLVDEEWPALSRAVSSQKMDPKGRNPNWDRWNQKENPQGSQSWNKIRNPSWRLKPIIGKAEAKEDIGASSAGEGGHTGILKTPPVTMKKELEVVRRPFCQKCGVDGHHARDCFRSLWCDICHKETHMTARCVLPKQNKPCMPIVGMAADGLGFYSSHFAKPLSRKPKRSFIGLITVMEGLISAEDLEKDFGFHFPWGKTWKATKCHAGYLMQFPSQEKLDEMINFPELKMKMSGAKISVSHWSSQAKPKSKLHAVWVVAENVPEELQNYQAIYELGSTIGAVEEVDILSLDSKDMVRFKVHVKSVAMIPPIIEVGVKPYLYDIFFKIDDITEEGWNDDSINLGKRASVDRQGMDDPSCEKTGKKARNVGDKMKEELGVEKVGELSSHGKNIIQKSDFGIVNEDLNPISEDPVNEDDEFHESEDDLLSSQDLEEFAKDDEGAIPPAQGKNLKSPVGNQKDGSGKMDSEKHSVGMDVEYGDGIRRSSRLETTDDMKIVDKATARAMAKDAFLTKGTSANPFSVLNSDNHVLLSIASDLNIELGNSVDDSISNLELIKSLELSRNTLVCRAVVNHSDFNPPMNSEPELDRDIQDNMEDCHLNDLDDAMVLRKGRKIQYRKNSGKKKKKKSSTKNRYVVGKGKSIPSVPNPNYSE
jgi:hypothetical protein